jgi:DNA helicase IV
LPEAFAEYIQENPLKFDAVIIDEGQDFRVEYWVTIEEMRHPDSYFYIFFDPDQNLFKTEMDFPIKELPFILNDNCRNTQNIFNMLKSYTQTRMKFMDGTPEGAQVQHFSGNTDKQRWRHLRDIVEGLIEDQHIKPQHIVIIGGHSMENTCLSREPKLGNYTVTEGQGDGPNLIRYHTYMKFKGCEADSVILLDVDKTDPRWSDLALYTAISRAKHLLYIIHKS